MGTDERSRIAAARRRARRSGSSDPLHGVQRPRLYDEAGFPVRQSPVRLAERVRRLLVG